MRFVRVALSAFGGAALMASSAIAADVAAIPPPPLWGFYVGGGVCYDWADFDIEKEKNFIDYVPTYTNHLHAGEWHNHGTHWNPNWHWHDGYDHQHVTYTPTPTKETKHYKGKAEAPCLTATIGYDYQIDQLFLVGIFASYDWHWQKKEGDIFRVGYPQLGDQGDAWLGNIATVAGRAGILVDPTLLVYALIGWSWTDGGFQLDSGLGASGNLNGPTIGGGIEKLFHQNWSARFEYRFIDFGSLSTGLVDCDWGCTKEATAHITDQSVRLVLTYRP